MNDIVKPVRYGIVVGLLGLTFGISWVFYLVLGHESIHRSFDRRALEGKKPHSLIQLLEPGNAYAHGPKADKHQHQDEQAGIMKEGEGIAPTQEEEKGNTIESAHDNPIMEIAHNRLVRGHFHAMGLALVTIAISFILAFTSTPDRIKTVVSVLTGVGGIIYPFAWIIMGYRTPALGPEGAEESIALIAGTGATLVLFGIFTAIIFVSKDILQNR